MKTILILLAMSSTPAFARVGQEGGGGHVIACYSTPAKETLQSVALYDLWEQKALTPKMNYLSFRDFSSAYAYVTSQLRKIDSSAFPNFWYERGLLTQAQQLYQEILNAQNGQEEKNQFVRFLGDDVDLNLIPDLDNFIEPKDRRCEIQAMANYRANGLLYISQSLFEKMSPGDQAAFILHEIVYRYRRLQGETNSVFTRRLTAQTMAGTPLVNTDDGISSFKGNSILKCSSKNDAKYVFFAYETALKDGIHLQFDRIFGFDAMNRTKATLSENSKFAMDFFKQVRCPEGADSSGNCLDGDGFSVKSSWTLVDGLPESIYLQHSYIAGVSSWSANGDPLECSMVPVTQ